MPKFDFTLTTRNGQKIESVLIYGTDLQNAERKLRQMYMQCEINQHRIVDEGIGKKLSPSLDIEELLTLIVKESMEDEHSV